MAPFYHYLPCLLILLPVFTSAQSYSNISLGSTLSTLDETPYWASPSGEFAFGFHPHPQQQQQQDLFLLGIWYLNISVETIVWTANQGKPVERGATVELTSNGVLSLRAPNGTEIWTAQAMDNSRVVDYAAMLDTGNFVLSTTGSNFVWTSFGNPTDTILPTQILQLDGRLSSRLTEEDYTIGRFQFILQTDGNLVLYTMGRPTATEGNYGAYWASNTLNNGSQLVFNESGYIYLTLRSGSIHNLFSEILDLTGSNYRRATLDFDGVFRQYTYPRTRPSNGRWPDSWSTSSSLPSNICAASFGNLGSGACGFNSYCRMNQDRPGCICAPGYTYLDPRNTFAGCKPNFAPQTCAENRLSRKDEGFEMRALANTDWPYGDYERLRSMTEDLCSETCLNDCFCAAAITGEGTCWLKRFPLGSGTVNSGRNRKALIKVGNSSIEDDVPSIDKDKDDVPSIGKDKDDDKKWIIPGSILFGIAVILNILFLVLLLRAHSVTCHKKQLTTYNKNSTSSVNLQSFTYKELEEATDGFKEELGRGAVSIVYKGVLKSATPVAVKSLDIRVAERIDKEFKAEMSAIGKTNHKNLVQLLGFCDEDSHRLLVYEFMSNGSLESFLFGSSRTRLNWNQRIQIAYGIARGLAYLHDDCSSQIIHCDVKPQNILLDDSFVARISDFGLAKLLKSEQTRTNTGIRGTRGYVAPEWFRNMAITAKVDVYSFGIMLLEIICCKKNVEMEVGEEDIDILSDFAFECCEEKALYLLVENDEEAKNDGKNLERLVMVALWCIQEDPSLRPSMKKVTQMLEGAVEVYMPPDPYSFISSIG